MGSILGGWAAQVYGFQNMYKATGYLFLIVLFFHLVAWGCGIFNFKDVDEDEKQGNGTLATYGTLEDADDGH